VGWHDRTSFMVLNPSVNRYRDRVEKNCGHPTCRVFSHHFVHIYVVNAIGLRFLRP
jgi:hypothetical protein